MNHAIGWGISFDEVLGDVIEVFARFGENSPDLSDYFGIASAWSYGFAYSNTLAGRKLKVGAAIGKTTSKEADPYSEKNLEIYTRHQLNQWSYLSIHYQSFWNSKVSHNGVKVFGFRMNFNF